MQSHFVVYSLKVNEECNHIKNRMSYVLKVALLEDEIASRTAVVSAIASEGY